MKTAPNGDKETAAFDLLNRTTSQIATSGTSLLYQYTYEHDLAGNVTKVGENYAGGLNNRTVNNSYDAINRLSVEAVSGSNAVTTAYVYDAANNRLSKVVTGGSNAGTTGYTYNALNQLTQYSDSQQSVALSYDANGNRATRTVTGGTASGGDTYGYDYENRLVTLAKGAGAVSGTYEYVYDYRTRRVVRDETAAGGVSTNVVFSGGLSVQEYAAGSTYASVEYIRGSDYGGGVGGILYTLRGSDASFTHENRRGDVIAKTDASGALTYQASYEAYGTRTQENGSTQDRQKANTKDEDPTGLLNEGFRYRDLETGVFITADPAGFKDGPNRYTYVHQNPWTHFDPEGLAVEANPDFRFIGKIVGTALGYGVDTVANFALTIASGGNPTHADIMSPVNRFVAKYPGGDDYSQLWRGLSPHVFDATAAATLKPNTPLVEAPITTGMPSQANFAQKTFNSKGEFSPKGQEELSKLTGLPIKTIGDLTAAIKENKVDPKVIPVGYSGGIDQCRCPSF